MICMTLCWWWVRKDLISVSKTSLVKASQDYKSVYCLYGDCVICMTLCWWWVRKDLISVSKTSLVKASQDYKSVYCLYGDNL